LTPAFTGFGAATIFGALAADRTSETTVDNYFTRKYIPEDKSELHTRRRENLKSHSFYFLDLTSKYEQCAVCRMYQTYLRVYLESDKATPTLCDFHSSFPSL
jgi:hypothetical protein